MEKMQDMTCPLEEGNYTKQKQMKTLHPMSICLRKRIIICHKKVSNNLDDKKELKD